MKATTRRKAALIRAASTGLICSLAALSAAQSSYRIGEDGASADAGPVRMARFDYMKGGVEWRPTEGQQWSSASRNLPIRQGAQIYAPDAARGEIQFDDGSDMRLGGGAVATLVTLYSDSQGEFTEVKLSNGLATFHLKNKQSLYQIDTPTGSIKSYGPAVIRVGDTSGVEIACSQGQATFDCACGKTTTVSKGQYLNETSAQAQPIIKPLPAPDQWDSFNETRDQQVYQAPQYVPSNIGLVAGDLNGAGAWQNDAQYGHVWFPREHAGWRPYSDGHWVFNDPYGWTWVGNEDWGWAPYHYGTWIHASSGWGWCPGPAAQCWSPAVVDFTAYNGNVGWCPLAPGDVHYGVSLGFSVGGLLLDFSIGRAGCYYPVAGGYCEPRPWNNVFVNRGGGYNLTVINNYYGDRGLGSSWHNSSFVPRNARFGGGTYVAQNGFGRGGGFHAIEPKHTEFFSRGKSFGMPGRGAGQISGPFNVRPVATSFTPSHSFASHGPSAAVLNRPVYRSSVPKFAARQSTGIGKSFAPPIRNLNARNQPAHTTLGPNNLPSHGAANRFAPSNVNRAAAAAAAARRTTGTHPMNHGVAANKGSFANAARGNHPVSGAKNAAIARSMAAHNNNVARAHAMAAHNNSTRAHAMAAHNNAARAHTMAVHSNAARAHAMAAHSNAARAHAMTAHRNAVARGHASHAAATHRETPAHLSRPSGSFHRSQPSHAVPRSFSAPHRSAPSPTPRRSFTPPSRPAPRSAPRQSAPRPAPQRGGGGHGGDRKHGH